MSQPRTWILCLKAHTEKSSGLHWDPKHQPANKDFLFAATHSEQSSLVTIHNTQYLIRLGRPERGGSTLVRTAWPLALAARRVKQSCLPERQRIAKHELLSVVQEEKVTVLPPFLCFMAWGWWLTISGPE